MDHNLDTIHDFDNYFIIDPITRTITNQTNNKNTLIQYDHNSEVFTFKIPRMVEDHDMSLSDCIQVHYINKGQSNSNPGIYDVTDAKVITDGDEDFVVCSWLISQNATQLTGDVVFQLKFICCRDDDPTIPDYVWSTKVFSAINVLPGINNADIIVETYPDVISQILSEIEKIKSNYNNAIGKSTGRVFDTEADMYTWLADQDNVSHLVQGDNLYIRDVNVPDYWWDGSEAQPLETLNSNSNSTSTQLDTEMLEEVSDGYIPLTIIKNSYLDSTGAIVDEVGNWSRTDYIQCTGQEYIVLSLKGAVNKNTVSYFYDTNKNPLTKFVFEAPIEYVCVPKNAAYFIVSANDNSVMKFLKIKSKISIDSEYTKNGVDSLCQDRRVFITIPYTWIRTNDGGEVYDASWCCTGFIPCADDDVLSITISESTQYNCFYDTDKKRVSSFKLVSGRNAIVVPENAAYFRISASSETVVKNIVILTKMRRDLDILSGNSSSELIVDMPDSWKQNAQTAYNTMLEKMKELSYDGVPFFIQTDSHGLPNDPAKWVDNTDKRVKNINLGDINLYNFNVANAKAYYDSAKELSNLITVYGNHDAHYNNEDDSVASYYILNEYYPSTNRRNKDRHSYFTVVDDTYNVKYVILCPYYLTADGTDKVYKFESGQIEWLIEELTKNDGYDIIILMHEPLKSSTLAKRDGTAYTLVDNEAKYSGVWDMLVKRKKKESGTITDTDGGVHEYDFTGCTSDYLCSLHGHTHDELYYTNEITEYTGDYHRTNYVCNFGVIDRANRKLFIYKFDSETVYDTWELTI